MAQNPLIEIWLFVTTMDNVFYILINFLSGWLVIPVIYYSGRSATYFCRGVLLKGVGYLNQAVYSIVYFFTFCSMVVFSFLLISYAVGAYKNTIQIPESSEVVIYSNFVVHGMLMNLVLIVLNRMCKK